MSYEQDNQKIRNLQFISNDHLLNLVQDSEFEQQKAFNSEYIQQEHQEEEWIYGQNYLLEGQHHQDNLFMESYNNQQAFQNPFPQEEGLHNGGMDELQNDKDQKLKVLEQNQELFNINQAKSVYFNKISQLMNDSVNQNAAQKKTKKRQEKESKQGKQMEMDSDNSSDRRQNQEKQEKNRIAAQNSRKRKKVYVELLETKVGELSGQLKNLKNLCQTQQEYIDLYGSQALFMKYMDLKQQWRSRMEGVVQKDMNGEPDIQGIENDLAKFDGLKNEKQSITSSLLSPAELVPSPMNNLVQGQKSKNFKYLARQQSFPQLQSTLDQINKKSSELSYIYEKLKVLQNSLMEQFRKVVRECDHRSLIKIFGLLLESVDTEEKSLAEQSYAMNNEMERKLVKTQ